MKKVNEEYFTTLQALGNARRALNALREHFDLMSKPYIEYIKKLEKEIENLYPTLDIKDYKRYEEKKENKRNMNGSTIRINR